MARRGFKVAKLPKGLLVDIQHVSRPKGTWAGGQHQEGIETITTFKGHITPLTNEDLVKDTNGSYSKDDQKLYTEEDFNNNEEIRYNGRRYEIQGPLDYQDLGTFRRYIIRRVGDTGES